MAGRGKSLPTRLGRVAVVATFAVLLAFPFYWMAITSFKRTSDLYDLEHNPFVFNAPPTLEHLSLLVHETPFLRWLWNTTLAGGAVVAITLALSVPAAYALARLTGRWGGRLGSRSSSRTSCLPRCSSSRWRASSRGSGCRTACGRSS